jgi:dienelactone hydrolase
VEETGETRNGIRFERVSFAPTYEGSRVQALVILPPDVGERRQTALVWPGSTAMVNQSVLSMVGGLSGLRLAWSGRILVVPVLKGTYERRDGLESTWPSETQRYTEYLHRWMQDVSRTLDYLETRPDVDLGGFAYFGISWGDRMAPIVLAVEPRFRVGVIYSGGLASGSSLPEVDQINYVTRVNVPVLMLNGLRDSVEPYDRAQRPLYDLLGTLEADKKHVTYETGHIMPRAQVARETLDWLDKYLGPVDGSSAVATRASGGSGGR